MVGGFHGMLLLAAKHSKSLVWWEDTVWKAVRNALQWTSNTVWSNGRISPYFFERPIKITSIWSKRFARKIPRLCIVCGGNLERRHFGRRHWRIGGDGTHQNSTPKSSMQRNFWRRKKWTLHVPSRRWNSQTFWRRSGSENTHLNQGSSWTEKNNKFFKENQMIYIIQLHFKKTQRGMMRKLKVTSGLQQDTVHAERRNISCSNEVHRRYQNNKYITGCIVGEKYWRLQERGWWKRIVRCMDRIHKIRSNKGRPPEGYTRSWRRLTRKQKTFRPDDLWADMWKFLSDAAKRKGKQWWAIEKPKLENARQLRGIFFIEPNDEEFKLTMKAAHRKLEVPMPAAMPCKTPVNCSGETCRSIGKSKTEDACNVDADESMRIRLEGVPHRYHEYHISAQRNKFIEPLQFGT